MLTAAVYLLIQVLVIALVIYLILFVLTSVIGVPIPPKVVQIIWVIFGLIVILLLINFITGGAAYRSLL